jgi:resuscitation-promoting factor RpfB
MHMANGGADPAAAALAAIPTSHSATLLEQERQQMILVDAASQTLTMVGSPKMATSPSSASLSDTSSADGADSVLVNMPPPDPGTAQSIAFGLLSSYGFASSQWGCLDDLWERESGWIYNAENASGAYGIPQALPGSKMASAGPDWETDPTTQIKWGLGYIQSVYSTPCGAWAHEEADGWY